MGTDQTTATTPTADTLSTVKISTEPFTCPSCIAKIEKAVGRLPGVEKVDVKFNSSKVDVTFDQAQQEASQIATVISDLGYPVTRVGRVSPVRTPQAAARA